MYSQCDQWLWTSFSAVGNISWLFHYIGWILLTLLYLCLHALGVLVPPLLWLARAVEIVLKKEARDMCPGHPMLWEISRTRRVFNICIWPWWQFQWHSSLVRRCTHDEGAWWLLGGQHRERNLKGTRSQGQSRVCKYACAYSCIIHSHCVPLHTLYSAMQKMQTTITGASPAQKGRCNIQERTRHIFPLVWCQWWPTITHRGNRETNKADRDQREYINTTYKRMCPN